MSITLYFKMSRSVYIATVHNDFAKWAKISLWKTCLSALNHLNKIAVVTVLQLLLIPQFIKHV